MTFIMMIVARNKKNRTPAPGFYNPQPMVQRYGTTTKIAGNGSSTIGSRGGTLTRSEYSGFSSNPSTNPASYPNYPRQQPTNPSTNPGGSYPTYPRQVHRELNSAMSNQTQQSVTAQSTML
jgi:hypothetical protein